MTINLNINIFIKDRLLFVVQSNTMSIICLINVFINV